MKRARIRGSDGIYLILQGFVITHHVMIPLTGKRFIYLFLGPFAVAGFFVIGGVKNGMSLAHSLVLDKSISGRNVYDLSDLTLADLGLANLRLASLANLSPTSVASQANRGHSERKRLWRVIAFKLRKYIGARILPLMLSITASIPLCLFSPNGVLRHYERDPLNPHFRPYLDPFTVSWYNKKDEDVAYFFPLNSTLWFISVLLFLYLASWLAVLLFSLILRFCRHQLKVAIGATSILLLASVIADWHTFKSYPIDERDFTFARVDAQVPKFFMGLWTGQLISLCLNYSPGIERFSHFNETPTRAITVFPQTIDSEIPSGKQENTAESTAASNTVESPKAEPPLLLSVQNVSVPPCNRLTLILPLDLISSLKHKSWVSILAGYGALGAATDALLLLFIHWCYNALLRNETDHGSHRWGARRYYGDGFFLALAVLLAMPKNHSLCGKFFDSRYFARLSGNTLHYWVYILHWPVIGLANGSLLMQEISPHFTYIAMSCFLVAACFDAHVQPLIRSLARAV